MNRICTAQHRRTSNETCTLQLTPKILKPSPPSPNPLLPSPHYDSSHHHTPTITINPPTKIAPPNVDDDNLLPPEVVRADGTAPVLVELVIVPVLDVVPVGMVEEETVAVVELAVTEEIEEGVDEIALEKEGEMMGVVVGGTTGPGAVGSIEKLLVGLTDREGLKIEGKVSRLEIDVSGGAGVDWACTPIIRSERGRRNFIFCARWRRRQAVAVFWPSFGGFGGDCDSRRGGRWEKGTSYENATKDLKLNSSLNLKFSPIRPSITRINVRQHTHQPPTPTNPSRPNPTPKDSFLEFHHFAPASIFPSRRRYFRR